MNEEMLALTDRYLQHEMTPEERRDFELRMQNDEDLARFVTMYRGIDSTMNAEKPSTGETQLRQTLQELGAHYFTGKARVKQGSFRRWWTVAAAALLLVSAGVYYFLFTSPSADELYATYAKHETLDIRLRGQSEDSLAQQAADAFNAQQYKDALPLLQESLGKYPDDVQLKFAEAICYMELNEYQEASVMLDSLASGTSAYADAARWNRALLALKQKQIDQCRTILSQIPVSSAYYEEAVALKNKLPR